METCQGIIDAQRPLEASCSSRAELRERLHGLNPKYTLNTCMLETNFFAKYLTLFSVFFTCPKKWKKVKIFHFCSSLLALQVQISLVCCAFSLLQRFQTGERLREF